MFGGPGDRPEVSNVCVLVTDGLPTDGGTLDAAQAAKDGKVKVWPSHMIEQYTQ